MIINKSNLRTLFLSYSAAFQGGFDPVKPQYQTISQIVPSTTRSNEYGWLGTLPNVREWLGDRVVNNISTSDYTIRNKSYELTIGVDRDDIEDDNLGLYSSSFQELGRTAATFPDQQIWPFLLSGWNTACYDKNPFFSATHPVLNAKGKPAAMSNDLGGAGTPWFLFDTSRAFKPVIWQVRKAFNLVKMDQETDEIVFNAKQFRYGIDGRANVGFGFWQLAQGAKIDLTPDNYAAARAAMLGRTGDGGRPLGITPTLLVVPPSLEGQARAILLSENNAAGATNPWKGTADLLVVPWLATA